MSQGMRGQTAIVGVGESTYYKYGKSPDPEYKLALKAILNACQDAGIDPKEIDGFSSYGNDRSIPSKLASSLGIRQLRSSTMQWGGGGGGCCAAVANAAALLQSGMAHCIVVFRSLAQGQYGRFGLADSNAFVDSDAAYMAPYGLFSYAQRFALKVRRYMHEHNVHQDALMAIALASYFHAQSNPRAIRYRRPLSESEYKNSRWIAEPFHLYDCCMENDGAAAILMVRADCIQKNRREHAYLLGAAMGSGFRAGASSQNTPHYAGASFSTVAPDLFRM